MGMSVYFSDDELISSLRQQFDRDAQYRINFQEYLNTAQYTNQGIIITVEGRRFLVHEYTGVVLRELFE